jgi:succinylarginine dihydrolase
MRYVYLNQQMSDAGGPACVCMRLAQEEGKFFFPAAYAALFAKLLQCMVWGSISGKGF